MKQSPHTDPGVSVYERIKGHLPSTAVMAALGSLAFGPGTQNYDAPKARTSAELRQNSERPSEPTPETPEEHGCTSIRDDKDGRYLGLACKSGDDTFTEVGRKIYEDRPYGIFFIKHAGVYMCGYGNDVLPRKNIATIPKRVVNYCESAQPKLEDRDTYLTDHNCGIIEKTGEDRCNDGNETRLKSDCIGPKRRVYGLFIPSQKSILNVEGKKVDHPFSRVRSNNETVKNVFYRFEVRAKAQWGNKKITSAVVRTRDVNGNLGWGHMRSEECIPEHNRKGGPLIDKLKK